MDIRNIHGQIHRFEFDVDWPPGHVACYLIDADEPILVDAGIPDNEPEFHTALKEHGFTATDIQHVLITHPHFDHIGLLPTVRAAADPTIYAPASAKDRLTRNPDAVAARVRHNCKTTGFTEQQQDEAVDKAVESLDRDATLLAPETIDTWITPKTPTDVGQLTIHPIHAPGHQADHLCYQCHINDDTVLLSGDMGIKPFRPVVMHDGLDDGHREAFDAFYTALDRLDALTVDRVYPGHGPIHTALSDIIQRDRDNLDHRLSTVTSIVANEADTVPEVAAALAGDRSIRYLIPEAMSALTHLDAHDAIESNLSDGVRHYTA